MNYEYNDVLNEDLVDYDGIYSEEAAHWQEINRHNKHLQNRGVRKADLRKLPSYWR